MPGPSDQTPGGIGPVPETGDAVDADSPHTLRLQSGVPSLESEEVRVAVVSDRRDAVRVPAHEEGDVSERKWGILILTLCVVVALAKAWWAFYEWEGSLEGKRGQIQFLLASGAVAIAGFLLLWGDK